MLKHKQFFQVLLGDISGEAEITPGMRCMDMHTITFPKLDAF